jgi:hypothetical protein
VEARYQDECEQERDPRVEAIGRTNPREALVSSIDSPHIVMDVIKREGKEPGYEGEAIVTVAQIWQYVSGFGTKCYKLIYKKYRGGMDAKTASLQFLATANIMSGTIPVCIFNDGKLTSEGEEWAKTVTPLTGDFPKSNV